MYSFEAEDRLETLIDKTLINDYKDLIGEDLIPKNGPCESEETYVETASYYISQRIDLLN